MRLYERESERERGRERESERLQSRRKNDFVYDMSVSVWITTKGLTVWSSKKGRERKDI